jgi:hypothetical protein
VWQRRSRTWAESILSPAGRYHGIDVNAGAIAWLQEHYQSYPNFQFTHADVYNKMYNPGGQMNAGDYGLPFPASTFDMVLLKSVFTHMLPADIHWYILVRSAVYSARAAGP